MRKVEAVVRDEVRGHISCGELVFSDIGTCLTVWSYAGATLDAPTARALGEALVWWAARRTATPTQGDLFGEVA